MKRTATLKVGTSKKVKQTTLNSKTNKFKSKAPTKTYVVKSLSYPFPKIYECSMRYNSVVARAITAGAFTNYLFSCNGLFDPDLTGTGTSVLYFAQLAAIYDHYTVISSSITVEPTANNTNTNTVIALYQDDDTSVPLNLQTALARPGATSCTNNFAISKAPKLYSKWSAASTFGNTQPWTDPELQGTLTANPAEQTCFVVSAEDQATATFALLYNVTITYWVRWDELKTISL